MLRNVFLKTLRDDSRGLLWWSVSLIAYALLLALFYPSIHESADAINQYMEAFPEAFRMAFLGEMADISSPAGYLTAELFSLIIPILFIIYIAGAGAGAIAGEEEKGTLDLLLANPISRHSVLLHKFVALFVGTVVLSVVLYASTLGGAVLVNMEIGYGNLAAMIFNLALLTLVFGSLALAAGCLRGKRGFSLGVTAGVALFSYLLNAFAPAVEALQPYRKLSLFYYYIGSDPLLNGVNLAHAAVLVVLTAIMVVLAVIAFNRRDITI